MNEPLNLSRRRALVSAAGWLASGALARAAQDVTFSTEIKVVNVLANVYGKSGEIIRDLTKDDFVLSEDGRPQTIRYFSRETDLPLDPGPARRYQHEPAPRAGCRARGEFRFRRSGAPRRYRSRVHRAIRHGRGVSPEAHLVTPCAGNRPRPSVRAIHAPTRIAARRRHPAL